MADVLNFKRLAAPDAEALSAIKSHDHLSIEYSISDFMRAALQDTPDVPTLATQEVRDLRSRLIREELEELDEAYAKRDITEVADAYGDLLYVVIGGAIAHGVNMKAIFTAVHNNNMQKIATGTRDAGGKLIKSPDHLPPDLHALLVQQWRSSPIRADANANTCTKCKAVNRVHKSEQIKPSLFNSNLDHELYIMCDGRRVKL